MARYKKRWLANLPKHPCARCGYTESEDTTPNPDHHSREQRPNTFVYAGPSAEIKRADVLTPETQDDSMEQGLLIGSDFGSSYGSVDRSEPTIEQPEEVVVGKGKAKKGRGVTGDKNTGKKEVDGTRQIYFKAV